MPYRRAVLGYIEESLFFQACPLTQYGHKFELIQQKGRSVWNAQWVHCYVPTRWLLIYLSHSSGGSRSNDTDLSSRKDERSARISAICPKETVTVLEKLEPSKCASFIYSIDLSLLFVYIKASSRSHLLVSLGFTLRKSISQGSSSLFWSGGGRVGNSRCCE